MLEAIRSTKLRSSGTSVRSQVPSSVEHVLESRTKVAIIIVRILLGLVFFAAGLFSILKLGKMGGMPADATAFLTLMLTHNYTTFVALLIPSGGLLLLVDRSVPIDLCF